MRSVIERLYTTKAPDEELRGAADSLERFAASLARLPRRSKLEGYAETSTAGDVDAFFDYSPFIGLSNALSPPIRLKVENGRVYGTAVFGSAYEGPPGCVHGGFVAAAFDEVLGFAQSLTGNPGMTGTLTIRYRSPTPLHAELSFEAWVDRTEGRKIFAAGTVHAGGRLTAEAEGIFISVDAQRFVELLERSGVKTTRSADEAS
jgi:acyl-coenzyme A thioesterase PaaI-like protein